jgi:phosphoglycolate phosphatase
MGPRSLGRVTTRGEEPQQPLVVGFDLDMTLIDPRPGVVASFAAVTTETGIAIDGDLVASRLGPPLEVELANWVAADRVDELADSYRAHYAASTAPACCPARSRRSLRSGAKAAAPWS